MTPRPELELSASVTVLGRCLRARGLAGDLDSELAFCRSLAELDLRRRSSVYWAARAVFLRHPDDLPAFEHVFARWWEGSSLEQAEPTVAEQGESDPRVPGTQHGGESLPPFRREGRNTRLLDDAVAQASRPLELPTAAADEPGEGERRGVLAAYSPDEVLTDADAPGYEPDELAAVRRLAAELRAAAPRRRSRRPVRSRRGRLDLRRTIRRSLATDGEALRPAFTSPSLRPRRLLFLCDVSGSMERHSRALLASLGAAVGGGRKTEAFVFATRLTRLTPVLAGRDAARALDEARATVADWSGGTRIGEVLADFRRRYGRLGLARGAVVIVVSDGWDRGDPAVLERELAALQLQCRRLVWINPRPADLDGQPLAVGMRAALPYVDDLVAGHDPRAVAALAGLVRGLGAARPARRPTVGSEP